MIKLLIFVITLISHNIYAQYDSKDENRIIDTSDQIIILYNLAKKNIEDKEFKKSLKLLKALSRRDDLGNYEIEIFNLLGDSYRKIKKPNFEKSETAYKKALAIDENNIATYVNLIDLYLFFVLAYFIWADAAYGKNNELTAMSSTKIDLFFEQLCFNFWFDVRVRKIIILGP